MDTLSRQDLIYAARALRVAALVDEKKAEEPVFFSSRDIFKNAAQAQRALADKFERVAGQMPPTPAAENPNTPPSVVSCAPSRSSPPSDRPTPFAPKRHV